MWSDGHKADHVSMFRDLVESLPLVTYIDEPGTHQTIYVSPQVETLLGYPTSAWYDNRDFLFDVVHPDDRDWVYEARRGTEEEHDTSLVYRVVAQDGRVFTVQSERVVLPDRTIGFWVDITERTRLEDELRHAQKLEAVGRLAGAVAHDFNNLLLAQRGFAELALGDLERGDTDRAVDDLRELTEAIGRCEALTGQLLAFSRRQSLNPEVLDVNDVVSGIEPVLLRLIGDDIAFTSSRPAKPVPVRADRGQLEQVIVNLTVNARDAMPTGGSLDIAVGSDRGRFAVLEVADSGCGMDEATAAQIFEPYFTTKGEA